LRRIKYEKFRDIKYFPLEKSNVIGLERCMVSFPEYSFRHAPMANSNLSSVTFFFGLKNVPPGTHQFKFLVDGEWKLSPGFEVVDDDVGTAGNNIVSVHT